MRVYTSTIQSVYRIHDRVGWSRRWLSGGRKIPMVTIKPDIEYLPASLASIDGVQAYRTTYEDDFIYRRVE